jgi:hypothetical protein
MLRLLLPACLALAAILLFQRDLSASSYQAQMSSTRLAQDDSAQAPDPSTAPNTGSSEEPGKPDQEPDPDQE